MKAWQNRTTTAIGAGALAAFTVAALSIVGCARLTAPQSHGAGERSTGRSSEPRTPQQVKPADARAQQKYYDKGLQHYSRENYGEARKAFQSVVDLGPNTSLGQKAQENLRKIQQIMKTLEEIESK